MEPTPTTPATPQAPPAADPLADFRSITLPHGAVVARPFAVIDPQANRGITPRSPAGAPEDHLGVTVGGPNTSQDDLGNAFESGDARRKLDAADPLGALGSKFVDAIGLGNVENKLEAFLADSARGTFTQTLFRAAQGLGFQPDPSYQTPSYGSPEYKALTDGIDPTPNNLAALAGAVSERHALYLRNEILAKQAADARVSSYGIWGVGGDLAVNLLDPTFLAVGALSGGIGVASKGSRIMAAIKAAGAGAAVNTGLSAALDAVDPTRDYTDLGYAAVLGAGLGVGGSVWATQAERALARKITAQVTNHLQAQEAVQYLTDRGIAVPPELHAKARAPSDLSQADSGGAARVNAGEVRPIVGEDGIEHDDVAKTAFSKVRFDIAARLRGNDDPAVRGLLGNLVGDPVGTGSEVVSSVGASEVAARLESSYLARFYTALNEHLPAWARDNNVSPTSLAPRTEFMERVASYIRGGDEADANVRGFGEKVRNLLNEVREDAQTAGVKGFDKIPQSDTYLPRQIDHAEVERWNRDYGTGKVDLALAQAIKATAGPHLDDEAIAKIAEGYHQRLREVGRGIDAAHGHGLRMDDAELLRQLVIEGGGDADLAGRVKADVEAMLAKRGTGEGDVRFAKHRLDLDENHVVRLQNNTTGQIDELPISSLFNGNVEELFNRYAGTMSGHIGLAKEAGITSLADFEQRLNQVRGLIANQSERESTINAAKVAHALITKVPMYDKDADSLSAMAARWGRILRAANFARQMGSMVWAHLGELGKVVSYGNLRAVMQHVPALREVLGGGMDKDLAREIVETIGLGTEHLIDRRFIGSDPMGSSLFNAANRTMQKVNRAVTVTQGFSHTISAMQTLAGKVVAQRLLNTALERGSTYSAKQLAFMGLDNAMAERVAGELTAHATVSDGIGGAQLRAMNLANWTDLDARDALIAAVRRDATRMVQTNEVGSAMAQKAAHGTLGKVVLQFHQYLVHSYAKSTLQGLAQGDVEAYMRFATSTVWAGLVYAAEQTLKREAYRVASAAVGNSNTAEREKSFDDNLSLEEVAKAGFARAGLFSLLPGAIDTVSQVATGHAFFNKRVSGLQSGAFSLDANPTSQAIKGLTDHLANLQKHAHTTNGDLRFWLSLLPFRNVTGIGQTLDALADKAGLPKSAK